MSAAESATNLLRATSAISASDARLLLAHVLEVPPTGLFTAIVSADQREAFADFVERRQQGIPVQYLTGRAAFRTVELAVGPGVFIPRPETEVMTGWALARVAAITERPPVVVELCAGSGGISLAINTEHPGCHQYAVELDPDAVPYARRNLTGTGVDLREGDMADAFPELDGTVDLVIANPPYIPLEAFDGIPAEVRDHEPMLALFSGADGLDALQVVADVAARLLRPGGWVAAEHAEVQHEGVQRIFVDQGCFDTVRDRPDLNDRPRFVTARRRGQVAGWQP